MFKGVTCNDSTLNSSILKSLFIHDRYENCSTGKVIYNVTRDTEGRTELYCGNILLSHISLNILVIIIKFLKLFQCICEYMYMSFLIFGIANLFELHFKYTLSYKFFLSFIPCEDFEISGSTPHMWTTASTSLTTSQGSFTSETDANLKITDGYSKTMTPTTFKMQFSESGLNFISSMY